MAALAENACPSNIEEGSAAGFDGTVPTWLVELAEELDHPYALCAWTVNV